MIPEVARQFEHKHTGVLATTVDQPDWEPQYAYVLLTDLQGIRATNSHPSRPNQAFSKMLRSDLKRLALAVIHAGVRRLSLDVGRDPCRVSWRGVTLELVS